jgi:ferredoxin--NADP+ reductase
MHMLSVWFCADCCYFTCSQHARQLHLHFLRSPKEVKDSGAGHVAGLELETNILQTSSDQTSQRAVGTSQLQSLAAQLVLESIGYKSHPIEGAPFDDRHGIIPNK